MIAVYIVLGVLLVAAAVIGGLVAWVVLSIYASARRHAAAARRRRVLKPGPDRRAKDRDVILARADELRRDTAAGIVRRPAPVNYERKVRA